MKKAVSLILSICIFLSFCCSGYGENIVENDPYMQEYAMLSEPSQQELIEEQVYNQLREALGEDYLIDVQAFYESREAIEEGLYNSKESEYFGFLLSEVDAEFKETPYVFCIDENGETVVKELVPYDDTWEKVLTNVAIGTGVILVCVTVSSLTVTAAPAVHLIFSYAAKEATRVGLKTAATAGIKTAVTTYLTTGDMEVSLKKAALDASEGFKWGTIGGAIEGSVAKTINLAGLKRATKMSMNDIADIQMHSNFTDTTIKKIHSMDEFKVYQDAHLVEYQIQGRTFLLPEDLDLNFVDPATGLTNGQLIANGYNPVDRMGMKYHLHHVGQKKNSPLALLTQEQHNSNDSILHVEDVSEVRPGGKKNFWKKDKDDALKLLARLLDLV